MRRSSLLPALILAAALASMANECSGPALDETLGAEGGANPALRSAFANLATHNIRDARYDFLVARDRDPSDPDAQIGAALTELLMFPEQSPSLAELVARLGGAPAQLQEQIYGERGLLQALGQDDPERRAEALDAALPWPQRELEEPSLLADRLPDALSLQDLAALLPALADELRQQGDQLYGLAEVAQTPFAFPATTFHGRTRVEVGASELCVLGGVLRAGAGGLRWVAAYDWSLPVAELRSSRPLEQRVASFNAVALRALRDPDALPRSREDLRGALDAFIEALRYANTRDGGSLGWHDLRSAQLDALAELLGDVRAALDGPAPLGNTSPRATLDLSPLFEGRVGAEEGLLRAQEVEAQEGGEAGAELNPAALEAMFSEGLMSPRCALFEDGGDEDEPRGEPGGGQLGEGCPEFRADDKDLGDLSEAIFGGFLEGVEDDYRL